MSELKKNKSAKKARKEADNISLTKAEREKIKSIAAGIETGKNRAFMMTCIIVAALFMGVFQSGPILSGLEKASSNLISDSAKVVAREWHLAMSRLGFSDVKYQMRHTVHTILPNTQGETGLIEIEFKGGQTMSLRGAAQLSEHEEVRLVEKEERTTTTFGWHRLRGSF